MALLIRAARKFAADERGNAGLEFVTSIPLLLGVMVFTAEYGEALRERMVLDNAVHDVARFLARSPVDDISTDPTRREPAFYMQTLNEAKAFMEARVLSDVTFDAQIVSLDQDSFRSDFYVIAVEARTTVDLPLLAVINAFTADEVGQATSADGPNPLALDMKSETQVRWLGGALPGSADCLYADRITGVCP